MTLHQLRIFMAVAQSSTLTRASKQLGLAQPSLSQQLAKLEESVGTRLFDRSHNRMVLTDAGQVLMRHAQAVLKEIDEAEANLAPIRHRQALDHPHRRPQLGGQGGAARRAQPLRRGGLRHRDRHPRGGAGRGAGDALFAAGQYRADRGGYRRPVQRRLPPGADRRRPLCVRGAELPRPRPGARPRRDAGRCAPHPQQLHPVPFRHAAHAAHPAVVSARAARRTARSPTAAPTRWRSGWCMPASASACSRRSPRSWWRARSTASTSSRPTTAPGTPSPWWPTSTCASRPFKGFIEALQAAGRNIVLPPIKPWPEAVYSVGDADQDGCDQSGWIGCCFDPIAVIARLDQAIQ